MRVAFLTPTGGAMQVVRIAEGLARRGYGPLIISVRPAGDLLVQTKLPVYTLNARGGWPDPRVFARLFGLLRDVRPQVLVTFSGEATLLGRVVAPMAGVHFLVSWLRSGGEGSFRRHAALALTDRLSRLTVANSPRVAEALASRRIVSRTRLRVIGDAIRAPSDAAPDPAVRHRYRIPAGEFVWLAVGHMTPTRDYTTLLEACARLDEQSGGWQLFIAGDGKARAELENRRDRLGLHERVQFLGDCADVEDLLAGADGFVLSSNGEGTPSSLVQAMLAARPCIATSAGGIPDLIEHDVTGWLVPPRRPDRLADRMLHVMQLAPERRRAVGAAGRAFAASAFDVHTVLDDWEDVISEAVRRSLARYAASPFIFHRVDVHATPGDTA